MKFIGITKPTIGFLVLLLTSSLSAQPNILHRFDTLDGTYPWGALVSVGTHLYGMTENGGTSGTGTIFRIDKEGTNYTLLHTFNDNYQVNDGYGRKGSLITDGIYLYGMCLYGGTSNAGLIFQIGIDGSDFTILHSFSGSEYDGGLPEGHGSLLLDSSYLYGMTQAGGGTYDTKGTIFRIGIDGNGFTLLHRFHNSRTYFYGPVASLISDGDYLYGMTPYEGIYDAGTIFRIGKDGNNFQLIHSFKEEEGVHPYGSLILESSYLYGMTYHGGIVARGTIFKIDKSGSGFTILHKFIPTTGTNAYGSLLLFGSYLYGMTGGGGTANAGVIFRIKEDGSEYQVLHNFWVIANDGASPTGTFIVDAPFLYGLTRHGGTNNQGTIFSITNVGLSTKASDNLSNIVEFKLSQNYPNPFNPVTMIHYALPEETSVQITIYNMLGRQINQLMSSSQRTGTYSIKWNGTDQQGNIVPAGIYFYQLQAGDFVQTKKMVLMK